VKRFTNVRSDTNVSLDETYFLCCFFQILSLAEIGYSLLPVELKNRIFFVWKKEILLHPDRQDLIILLLRVYSGGGFPRGFYNF
jgi:hypothetical protein